jgi:hypothetical protein
MNMNNGAALGGWAVAVSVVLTFFVWAVRNIVASIVRAEIDKQSEQINKKLDKQSTEINGKFEKLQESFSSHVQRYHSGTPRR